MTTTAAGPPARPQWRRHLIIILLVVLAALLLTAAGLLAQDPGSRPPEVTDSSIARGRRVFHGTGGCVACHGIEAVGTDSGPPLAQGVWMHGPDTWRAIRSRVVHGIPRDESTRGTTMPMRGMSELSESDIDAVAAYVWQVSHQAIRPRSTSSP